MGVHVKNIWYREDANFLEGFYYDKNVGTFYESKGLYEKSSVHRLAIDRDNFELTINEDYESFLPREYFGEGLAPRSPFEFALLTYKERTIFTVDRLTMQLLDKTF